ncbi:malto-oligosyltrehalose trehalohydrolase [Mucilaginibacter sabulilitoris]|uniref:Malto-oligosyltrehalose trehalohydrolase n=1 Tax=Mucilaginibacter sabulilitoris TaxID=1173583 RepID=A0ABZ0TG39_9SPHI|nr:malto-oligosyltrehalose trehalohydrolase [Mucilaginibacter sabulilitoris]WPU91917.1 malto-oligosyltrehalose trehalohydrolase [Mucilaginibacter sabulilitoris]
MEAPSINKRNIGINFNGLGLAEILLWAPYANKVSIKLDMKTLSLIKQERGYWTLSTDEVKPGDTYWFDVDGKQLSDPASLFQSEGVHGPSLAFDLNAYKWTDAPWQNPPLEDYIFYELHTGTFTSIGTFKGIEDRLDYLVSLGITAIEIMPVAQFPGERNWGYDGVFPFAVQNSYGGPQSLQHLIDTCHNKGLAVVLDVVYNHIGPEGNYLHEFGPYFTDKYHTPWGSAINFDDAGCDEVRQYFIDNALMWFHDFHVDALRMDAVHAIKDFSPKHILQEISEQVVQLTQTTGRTYYLIAECDLNDTRFINPVNKGGFGLDAQWIDEFHHALRVAAGGERNGYYTDFNGIEDLALAYQNAYVYHGQYSEQRQKTFGTNTAGINGRQFVAFSQNHDQVGNRMLGERSGQLFGFEMQKLMAAAVMISPFLPLLFMGEERSEPNPFLFFVSHTDKRLIEAVRKGRKTEFADFHARGEAPDPQALETFERSKLSWDILEQQPYQTMLHYYKTLIGLRKHQPALKTLNRDNMTVETNAANNTLMIQRWTTDQQLICLLNFSGKDQPVAIPEGINQWQKLFDSAHPKWNGPVSSPEILNTGLIAIPPATILIYTQYHA